MEINWLVVLGCCLIPPILGMIWYNPKVLGTAWLQASGMTEEKARGGNMPLMMGLTIFMGLLISTAMLVMVIHQMHIYSTVADDPGLKDPNSAISLYLKDFMDKYGHNFRTFKHGALHGTIGGLFIAMPIITIGALFERKGFKYIAIHVGYWIVCMALIGGVICQWA